MDRKLQTLWTLTRGQRLRYALALLAMGGGTALIYGAPLVTRSALNGWLSEKSSPANRDRVVQFIESITGPDAGISAKLALAGALVLLLTIGSGVLGFLRGRCVAMASESIARNLRQRLYTHLQHVPCSYHDKAQTGDLVQRCTSDVDTVRQFYGNQFTEVFRALILIIIVVPTLLWLDWRQGLISLALVPVMVAFALVFFAKARSAFKAMDEAEGAMTTVLQENLTGIRVVRAFARHDYEKSKFHERNDRHRHLNYRWVQLMAVYWSIADLMVFLQMSAVLLTCAYRVMHGTMKEGDLVAFTTYVGMYVWPLRQMGRVVADLGKATVSIGRVQEILDHPAESNPAPATLPQDLPQRSAGAIDLHDVTFRHGEKLVLDRVTLSIKPGETIAFVGPSGSGKSTLVQLLLRFYDYQEGLIRLDGREIRDLDRKYVRRQFGVVMQEPFLYSKSLRDNIKLGRAGACEDEIVGAAKAADVHGSIESFEKKYDTLVGERGVTLSGGQRQRVAIARALLIEAPILVLDDALSAVDTRTETHILHALKQRRGRQTTLLIAHRLSTLMHADRIVVLENGRISQYGSHEQLVGQDGLYRRLWQIQGELEDDLKTELEEPKAVEDLVA